MSPNYFISMIVKKSIQMHFRTLPKISKASVALLPRPDGEARVAGSPHTAWVDAHKQGHCKAKTLSASASDGALLPSRLGAGGMMLFCS